MQNKTNLTPGRYLGPNTNGGSKETRQGEIRVKGVENQREGSKEQEKRRENIVGTKRRRF